MNEIVWNILSLFTLSRSHWGWGDLAAKETINFFFFYPVMQKQRHKSIDTFQGNQLGAQSEKRRHCGKYCMMFQRDGSGSSPRLQSRFLFVPVATCQDATLTLTPAQTGVWIRASPISSSSGSPACTLSCSSPLLLMIFLIRRKKTRARGLSFDLLSLNAERLPEPSFVRSGWHRQHTHTHTHTMLHHSHVVRWTCWPRHQLLWIGLIKSRADPLSTAWENPQQSVNVRIFAASVSSSTLSHPQLMY